MKPEMTNFPLLVGRLLRRGRLLTINAPTPPRPIPPHSKRPPRFSERRMKVVVSEPQETEAERELAPTPEERLI